MRQFFVLILGLIASPLTAALPADLTTALEKFRADPPAGWSFRQTTTAQGESLVEQCDATRPEFDRWKLIAKNGRPPTTDELHQYAETRSRRSRAGTAPKITDQIDVTSIETVEQNAERITYRARLAPGEKRDATAAHLRVSLVLHRPTNTIESFQLASAEPFSPTLGVRIEEMRTTITFSRPTGSVPALPQKVTTRVRGRAFFFKSLDADMTVAFTDYVAATGK